MKRMMPNKEPVYFTDDVKDAFEYGRMLGASNSIVGNEKGFEQWRARWINKTVDPLDHEIIAEYVSIVMEIPIEEIKIQSGRRADRTMARNMVSWASYLYTDVKLQDIADYIGYDNHTSIIHGYKTIIQDYQSSSKIRAYVDSFVWRMMFDGYDLTERERVVGANRSSKQRLGIPVHVSFKQLGTTEIYSCIEDASDATGIDSRTISRACRKITSQPYGYVFQFLEDIMEVA